MFRHSAALALVLIAAPALADIVPDDMKSVRHEVTFEGLDQDSLRDYRFVLYHCYPINTPTHVVEAGKPVRMHNCSPRLHAVRGEIPVDRDALEAFFADRPRTGPIRWVNYVPESSRTARIVTVYRVVGIDGETLKIERIREETFDAKGNRIDDVERQSFLPGLLALAAAAAAAGAVRVLRRRRAS